MLTVCRCRWILWFQHRTPGSKNANYEEGIKNVAAFSSVGPFVMPHFSPCTGPVWIRSEEVLKARPIAEGHPKVSVYLSTYTQGML